MPDIVKACLNSIRMYADRHPVIVITETDRKSVV